MITLKQIEEIAKNNVDGFTINMNTGEYVSDGYAVAEEATQNSFGITGLENVIEYIKNNNNHALGGWYNKKNNQYYFDAVRIVKNENVAKKYGIMNKQIAIFNLSTLDEILL
jgi:hypothetical protein